MTVVNYTDLSRRGLIAMCKDYDVVSEGDLIDFLTDNSRKYETVRAPEIIIDKVDKIAEVSMEAYDSFKKAAARESKSTCGAMMAKMAGKGIGTAVKFVAKKVL